MAEHNRREERINSEVVFEGRMLRLEKDMVLLPNGHTSFREVVRHPGAVGIIAVQERELLLVRQYRYAVEQETLEIPAGKLDPRESPFDCAIRELREETGFRGRMEHISTFFTTPGFTDEVMHLFLARDLVWDPLTPDEDEFIGVVRLPWDEAVFRVQQNKFNDAKTILGILLAQGRV
ncbi:ADP-ribose pyrophosphatase [Desulfosporosinus orientis DSM 765]|uniref:ADP-ribose pyrophosphatase n=1 Tax=Desulfosporosinus orientis (strain ATCC 19365 / DSM 765 / NCIMB 8382 / VKM B-1628 / Singapore I) TaxID=768706 RepID=G7W887_DESOD|nr:NUDIX hydrolase [Desulfosporosinus orientis]AET66733.1 ADP-ribose pyrophosphatase [Desulfosporosinus orientis DSM 765]